MLDANSHCKDQVYTNAESIAHQHIRHNRLKTRIASLLFSGTSARCLLIELLPQISYFQLLRLLTRTLLAQETLTIPHNPIKILPLREIWPLAVHHLHMAKLFSLASCPLLLTPKTWRGIKLQIGSLICM